MSKKTIEYLKTIENDKEFTDAFVISYLGILGLSVINSNNNLLTLKLKKYRQILNQITPESLDIYYIIQTLYDQKKIRMDYALQLIDILQRFRMPNFTFSLIETDIKKLMEIIPPMIYRNLSGDIKLFLKAYLRDDISEWDITKLVNKFYSFCARKKMTELDFYVLAKKLKRKSEE